MAVGKTEDTIIIGSAERTGEQQQHSINVDAWFRERFETLTTTQGKIAFIFPGQGSQFLNMGIDLYRSEPIFTAAVDECALIIYPLLGEDIRTIIYPAVGDTDAQERLNNTYYTQAALSVVSYALAKFWISKGIQPSLLVGHSIGEFMAAHFAGIFNLRDALFLITMRGKIMADLPGGSMLAVRARYEHIMDILPATLSLAAINTPESCVVAGGIDDVAAFTQILEEKGIASRLLKTSHAFHSFMMMPVVATFEDLARSVVRCKPRIPIISTVTGRQMTDNEARDVSYWSRNIISPVRFSDAIAVVLQTDVNVILEAGPGNVMTRLVQQIAGKKLRTVYCFDANTFCK